MNANQNQNQNRWRVSAFALTAAVSIVTVFGPAGTANASEPRGSRAPSDASITIRSYGEPLVALGGQTLAQYLSDHMASRVVARV